MISFPKPSLLYVPDAIALMDLQKQNLNTLSILAGNEKAGRHCRAWGDVCAGVSERSHINPTEARKRGEASHYRGISHEQIYFVTSSDRNGHIVYKTAGTGRPSSEDINEGFEEEIECKSELYVDGMHIYDDLARKTECDIRHLKGNETYNKVEQLNNVNCIHSIIKRVYAFYRGVASYYLDRYLALFVFMRRLLVMDDSEITELIVRKLKEVRCNVPHEKLKHVYMTAL